MTPKSLLRAEFSTSRAEDFTSGKFHEIIPDSVAAVAGQGGKLDKIERVILCSGKVYFDLIAHREKEKIINSTIIRVEQLYPLDEKQWRAASPRSWLRRAQRQRQSRCRCSRSS